MAHARVRPHCPAPPGRKTKRSRASRRRAIVLVLVHVVIAAHIAHWWTTGSSVTPIEPSEAMELSKHSIINTGLVFFVLAILSTLVLGRFFCGWGCHLVALQDLCRTLLLRLGIHPKPLRSKALAWVPVIAFVYMFLWPLVERAWLGDDFAVRGSEFVTEDFWATFPPLWVALLTFLCCGFAAVYFLGSKGFCTYGCPYGAIFGAVDRLAPGRIRVTDACEGCGHCTITCSSNVQVAQEVRDYGMVVDPGCMKCMDCVSVCPNDALYFGFGAPPFAATPRREPRKRRPALGRGEEVLLAVAFLVAFLTFRGLYQSVPFLFSLGIAGIASYVVLQAARLVTRPSVTLQNLRLKHAGRLLPAGRAFVAVLFPAALFWVHSAFVNYHDWRTERAFEPLIPVREAWFAERPPLTAEAAAAAQSVLHHAGLAERFGLLPSAVHARQLAWASLVTGDDAGFLDSIQTATAVDFDNPLPHLELGHFLRARGESEAAIASYRLAVEARPAFLDSYGMLAQMMLPTRAGEFEAILAASVAREPRVAALRDMYAGLLEARGETAGAEEQYRAALAHEPTRLPTRGKLADLLLGTERRAECIEVLEAGVRADPGEPAPLRVLAKAHLLLGQPREARAACDRALTFPREVGESHRLMAQILDALGDSEGRETHLRRAREADAR